MGFLSIRFKQFFLDRSGSNLIMLIIDVCLMLNCLLFEKFYSHYALCDFDSILLHCTTLFIRLSIDREQIFDVTFQNPPMKNPAYATARAPLNSILTCQFKRITRKKWRVFVLKVAILGPHLAFL